MRSTLLPALLALASSLAAPTARAASCDAALRRADTSSGEALVGAFEALAKCDAKLAEDNYTRLMTNASDADTLVALSQVAIDHDIWTPVWRQLGRISSYDARDEVARRLGERCGEDEKILSFLQGAYFGLRDIEFQQWDDAFLSCEAPELDAWLVKQVEHPPNKVFDEKYNALVGIFVQKKRREALPHLAKAAIAAAGSGPYDALLMQINAAVQPELGGTMSPEDRQALKNALVQVANGVDPAKAKAVADQLANAGFQEAAAGLLPRIYPDRVQEGGRFLYGSAAIEAGDCKGVKTAVIHYAPTYEPGKRWVILDEVEPRIRQAKPRLAKCTATFEDWPVATTPEPVKNGKEVEAWAEDLAGRWREKGYEVSTRGEKAIELE